MTFRATLAMLLVAGSFTAAGWLLAHSGALPSSIQAREHRVIEKLRYWRRAPVVLAVLAAGGSAASAGAVPPTEIGISITAPDGASSFSNLALAGHWILQPNGGRWTDLPNSYLDANGELKALPTNGIALRTLSTPSLGRDGVAISCTYSGRGDVQPAGPGGLVADYARRANGFTFRWTTRVKAAVTLKVLSMDPAQPVRDLDCRTAGTPRSTRFTPDLLDIIRGFRVLRFMDWQRTNANAPVTWATRHTPQSFNITQDDGVSVEDMVQLATLNHSDAWFNMPWNADADYIRRFAQYVHDHLPPDRKVYVECSNEVWNWGFPVSRQAMQEGLNAHLGADAKSAFMHRYAQRLVQIMDIWAAVFRDAPQRLVRVGATQHFDTYKTQLILDYGDTAKHIDAFATAPYVDYDHRGEPHDLNEIYRRLDASMAHVFDLAAEHKRLAAQHGLRYVAYEAGQGVVEKDIPLAQQIQRDPRMYGFYKRYIATWRNRIGDTINLFGTVFQTRQSGAWGLIEYDGQPASEAPKLRAVREELQVTK